MMGHASTAGRESVYGYSAHGLRRPLRMVRTRTHKLVLTPSEMGERMDLANDPWELFELYDLVSDPHEMRNFIGRPEARLAQDELVDQMRTHCVRLDDPFLAYLDSMRAAHL
jgi:arylsulfatase A-like enzyme